MGRWRAFWPGGPGCAPSLQFSLKKEIPMKMSFHHKLLFALLMILLPTLVAQGANLTVDCNKGGTIGAAIAKISVHNPLGPNVITVTGACHENVSIVSLNNLTLQASKAGASISDASGGTLDTVYIEDAQRFAMNGFTINGSVNCVDNAVCRTQGNTIQNSQTGYGFRVSRSHADSQSDVIQNNNGEGALAVNDSRVLLIDDTLQNNADNGAVAQFTSFLQLANNLTTTTITNNGNNGVLARAHGTVRLDVANITGNGNDGVRLLEDAVLHLDGVAPTVNSISNNGNSGVHVGDQSFAFFPGDGSAIVTGNLSGTDVLCTGQFSATRGALTNIGGGTTNCTEPAPQSPQNDGGSKGPAGKAPLQ
jgi:hypothetical protein